MRTYQGYFNRYSKLLKDRNICDGFATAEKYDGPTKIKVSYEEDPKVQVSEQEKYVFSENQISSSQKIGDNTKTTYQIYDISPSGFDMSYNINAAPFEQLRIMNYSHYNFYQTSAEYVDFGMIRQIKKRILNFQRCTMYRGILEN